MRILLAGYARSQMHWARRLQTLAAESEGATADYFARRAVSAYLNARDTLSERAGLIVSEK